MAKWNPPVIQEPKVMKKTMPSKAVTDPSFKYVSWVKTDIRRHLDPQLPITQR